MGNHLLISNAKDVSCRLLPSDHSTDAPSPAPANPLGLNAARVTNSRKLVPLGALDDIVQHQHRPMIARLEDENILILALLMVQDLIDLECHGLAGPHVGYLTEPTICRVQWRVRDGSIPNQDEGSWSPLMVG